MPLVSHVPLTAILWDFDGVLNANARRGRYHWARDFEADTGHDPGSFAARVFADDAPVLEGREDILDRIRAWREETGAALSAEDLLAYWLDRDFHPDPDLQALSARIAKRGLEQAVFANADPRRAAWIEERLEAFPHVSRLVASCHIGRAKPAPEAFAGAAEAMGRSPGEMYYIDDDPRTANAAGGAGFRSFRWTPLSLAALENRLPRR